MNFNDNDSPYAGDHARQPNAYPQSDEESGESAIGVPWQAQASTAPPPQSRNRSPSAEPRDAWRYGALGSPYRSPEKGEPTPAQRRHTEMATHEQEVMQNAADLEDAEQRLEDIYERRDQRRERIANLYYDRLADHGKTLPGREYGLRAAVARLSNEARIDGQKAEALQLYHSHKANVEITSSAKVRQLDMMRWLEKALPDHLHSAINDLAEHHHKSTKLPFKMHNAEVELNQSQHDDCAPDAFCHHPDEMFAASADSPAFGFDSGAGEHGFAAYPHHISDEKGMQHLRARFEVRKTWLAYAPTNMRFGFGVISDEGWSESLDCRMGLFMDRGMAVLHSEAMKQSIIEEQGNGVNRDVAEGRAIARLHKLRTIRSQLRQEMLAYKTSLNDRAQRIRAASDLVEPELDRWLDQRVMVDGWHAYQTIIRTDALRAVVAQGINIAPHRVKLHPYTEAVVDTARRELARSEEGSSEGSGESSGLEGGVLVMLNRNRSRNGYEEPDAERQDGEIEQEDVGQ